MTDAQEKYAKSLRQNIMANFASRGMLESRKQICIDWGFKPSLRSMTIRELKDLKSTLNGTPKPQSDYLDKQGKYIFSLSKQIGWEWERVLKLIKVKYGKKFIKQLDSKEKRALINTLKSYKKGF